MYVPQRVEDDLGRLVRSCSLHRHRFCRSDLSKLDVEHHYFIPNGTMQHTRDSSGEIEIYSYSKVLFINLLHCPLRARNSRTDYAHHEDNGATGVQWEAWPDRI
jgi:hypothetical protein